MKNKRFQGACFSVFIFHLAHQPTPEKWEGKGN